MSLIMKLMIANTSPTPKTADNRTGNLKKDRLSACGALSESDSRAVILELANRNPLHVLFEPSPEEIKRATAKIQEGWSAHERAQRAGYHPARLVIDVISRANFDGSNFASRSL